MNISTATPERRQIGLIWAQGRGGVIGREGKLPWSIPEDMQRFRQVTAGHTVVMGRRTWESLPERFRPLPQRRNVVLSRDSSFTAEGAEVVDNLTLATKVSGRGDTVWIMGGGEVYKSALSLATYAEVTEVDSDLTGDTYAPALTPEWQLREQGQWLLSSSGLRYRFCSYQRLCNE